MSQPAYRLSDLKEMAKQRLPGYYEEIVSRGVIQGDLLLINIEAAKEVAARYHPGGVGTYIHKVLKPVAKVIDKVAGTDYENCGECLEEAKDWNSKWGKPGDLPPDALA